MNKTINNEKSNFSYARNRNYGDSHVIYIVDDNEKAEATGLFK